MNVDRCLGFLYLAPYLNPRFRRCAYACCVIVFLLNFMKMKHVCFASEDEAFAHVPHKVGTHGNPIPNPFCARFFPSAKKQRFVPVY